VPQASGLSETSQSTLSLSSASAIHYQANVSRGRVPSTSLSTSNITLPKPTSLSARQGYGFVISVPTPPSVISFNQGDDDLQDDEFDDNSDLILNETLPPGQPSHTSESLQSTQPSDWSQAPVVQQSAPTVVTPNIINELILSNDINDSHRVSQQHNGSKGTRATKAKVAVPIRCSSRR
jgi:hypothetical protein